MTDIPHGTAGGYTNHKCRCSECRAAWAAYNRKRRAERVASVAAGRLPVLHGRLSTYINYGCRCLDCTSAQSKYNRERYLRRGGPA